MQFKSGSHFMSEIFGKGDFPWVLLGFGVLGFFLFGLFRLFLFGLVLVLDCLFVWLLFFF